ncbi:MAG: S8 family peptidase [Clostridiales bacterium]|nr:S8 family peptidase [Clostridiales bacterium]
MPCKEEILSNDYADIIRDYMLPESLREQVTQPFCQRILNEEFAFAYVKRSEAPPLSIGAYGYASIPKLYGLMQTFRSENLTAMGNLRIQGSPLSLQGQGVILGFIDTGIRYQSEAFVDEQGNSRILSIWDQTIQSGSPPEGFDYGTEYSREEINRALRAENPLEIVPTRDVDGHGTAMASAAAGSVLDMGLTLRGAAPRADIAVVKLKEAKRYLRDYYLIAEGAAAYQENDIMEAVKYLEQMAIVFQRPVVIVLGLGTNLGNHAGESPLGSYLNSVASKRSRAIVVCGGNEGDKRHHFENTAPRQVEIRVSEGVTGFCMEMWNSSLDSYTLTIQTPGGERTAAIDFRSGYDRPFSFVFDRTVIEASAILAERTSGDELVFLRFQNPTQGIWRIIVSQRENTRISTTGLFHMWLPITQFLDGEVDFLEPSPDVTLTEPSNAENVITISAYNGLNGNWAPESGRGFAGDNRIKPEFAAPGVQVSTAVGERSGSSMAAALAAGCIAQFMEWAIVEGNAPLVETRLIKSYFIRGALREEGIMYPDNRWGYGKLNISGTFETLARL